MIFLIKTDIEQRLTANILTQITGDDDSLLDNAEATAIGTVTDMLSEMYNLEIELAKTAQERHTNLKTWLVSLSAYNLYAHIPDNEVPERILKDYDDTLNILTKIAQGKLPTTLTPIENEDGTTKRVVRYGFGTKRNHEII